MKILVVEMIQMEIVQVISETHRMVVIMVERKESIMTDKEIYQKQAARDILSIIEEVCFSKTYTDFRINYGSNGQRDYIITYIKNTYDIE